MLTNHSLAHELTEKLLGKMPVIETTPEEDAKYEKEVREEWDVMKASVGEDTLYLKILLVIFLIIKLQKKKNRCVGRV